LIAKLWRIDVQITAISPLTGQPLPKSRLVYLIRRYFDPWFREKLRNSNFYPNEDYAGIIKQLFERFELDQNALQIYRGYSTDRRILDLMAQSTFHIVYVDGDHTLKGASHDFNVFGRKVVSGGWLVADDASCALPGSAFWKGHQAVSHATEMLPAMGFRNVLNVGHNRIYELKQ
jgi:hypothetical protein